MGGIDKSMIEGGISWIGVNKIQDQAVMTDRVYLGNREIFGM